MPGKRKRQAYDNAFKLRVIEFPENLNNNSAAEREFTTATSCTFKIASVYEIRKQKISDSTYEANILKISHFGTKVYPPTYEPGRLMTAFLLDCNIYIPSSY